LNASQTSQNNILSQPQQYYDQQPYLPQPQVPRGVYRGAPPSNLVDVGGSSFNRHVGPGPMAPTTGITYGAGGPGRRMAS
jgi:hypothetical protein